MNSFSFFLKSTLNQTADQIFNHIPTTFDDIKLINNSEIFNQHSNDSNLPSFEMLLTKNKSSSFNTIQPRSQVLNLWANTVLGCNHESIYMPQLQPWCWTYLRHDNLDRPSASVGPSQVRADEVLFWRPVRCSLSRDASHQACHLACKNNVICILWVEWGSGGSCRAITGEIVAICTFAKICCEISDNRSDIYILALVQWQSSIYTYSQRWRSKDLGSIFKIN